MSRILIVLLLSTAFGVLLAADVGWPLRPGLVGAALMLVSALIARHRWQRLGPEQQPGSPERALWHSLVSLGIVGGHLLAALWRVRPDFEMHSLAGHALAIDSWMLVAASLLAFWIARDPDRRRDERDDWIAGRARRVGHRALQASLLLFALALAFGAPQHGGRVDAPLLAQALIVLVMLDWLLQTVVCLTLYRRDAALARDAS